MLRRFWFVSLLFLLSAAPTAAQSVRPLDFSQQSFLRADDMGLTWIAYPGSFGRDAQVRYQQALEMGAGWHRYPIYWNEVETTPGAYNWAPYDQMAEADRAAGLQTNAILLGTATVGGGLSSLSQPVFVDGTDSYAPGKAVNPNNRWATFTFQAVNRYKPGGVLAQALNWPAGSGIRVWEAWNEPDLDWFWRGTKAEYARLLKVTYLAAKAADPDAQVMFGGLAYGNPDTDDWLDAVLQIYSQDPTAPANNWYMDLVGLHSYNEARRTGLVINRVRQTLRNYGLERPIWLNETGVPVWNDYPGPLWAGAEPESRRLRATMDQQAAYVIQSTAYAFAAGADKVLFHQLYDDCGNEPGNHSPTERAGGDAYGFYRNPRGYNCFSQHPQPGTPRPAVEAYKTAAQVFGSAGFRSGQIQRQLNGAVLLTFENEFERVTVVWSEAPNEISVSWPALRAQAQLVGYGDQRLGVSPVGDEYTVTLTGATLNDDPQRPPGQAVMIGGEPIIVVERGTGLGIASADPVVGLATPRAPLPAQVGSVLGGPGAGTLSGLADFTPPATEMTPLPETSPATFTVQWTGYDIGGIERYLVWVRVNDGDWRPWMETSRTQADYTGEPGSVVAFAVWAVDKSGNWSLNTDLQPQTFTVLE